MSTDNHAAITIYLSLMPQTLQILSISKNRSEPTSENLRQYVMTLIQLLFYGNGEKNDHEQDRFMSYVETFHEYSIVLEQRYVSKFQHLLKVEGIESSRVEIESNTCWKALQISPGYLDSVDEITILQKVSTPLANAEISVFQISTYETDYLLIRENDVGKAIACLKKRFLVDMENLSDASSSRHSSLSRSPSPRFPSLSGYPMSESMESLLLSPPESDKEVPVHKHALCIPNIHLQLFQMKKMYVKDHVYNILQLLFFPAGGQNDFISYTETGDEVSMMTSDATFLEYAARYDIPMGLVTSPDTWCLIQVGNERLGFTETGIVASQSRVISETGSAIFYISTFAMDYVLVRNDDWDRVYPALSSHFKIHDQFLPFTSKT